MVKFKKEGTPTLNYTPPLAQHLSRPLIYYVDCLIFDKIVLFYAFQSLKD